MQKRSFDNASLVSGILKGEVRSASRLLTLVERRDPNAIPALKALYPHTGKAKLLGITGPAGVGKSTLINQLISRFRKKNQSIGVLAVDPSSPFTGGAILGDRLRMHQHFLDDGVFIRSLVTKGMWGGIGPSLFDAIHVLDAMGKDIIIIETIGVGQDEIQIAQLSETVVLVLSPGIGDEIQTLKAGLLEIGDIIAINKTDLDASGSFFQALQELGLDRPILKISAEKGTGLPSLISCLKKIHDPRSRLQQKKNFVREELRSILQEQVMQTSQNAIFTDKIIEAIVTRKENPYTLIESLRSLPK